MRLILDTNVLARVVMSPHGPAAALFDLIRSEHMLISSLEMLWSFRGFWRMSA
jgi:predicted nucleic acid-binding protein